MDRDGLTVSAAGRAVTLGPAVGGFEDRVAACLDRLRRALGRVIEQLPEVRRPVDLRRRLDLDAALAWQVFSFVGSDDLLSDARMIPKQGSMQRFILAAAQAGVGTTLIADVERAYAEYESAVTDQAGDRDSFDAMLASLRPPDGSGLVKVRRSAFRANAAIWGVSVRTMVNVVMYRQRPTGEHDCLCVRGRVGVRGLRRGVQVAIHASTRTWGGILPPNRSDERIAVDGCKLIESACSVPLPRVVRRAGSDESVRDYLMLDGVGRASEATVYWTSLSAGFLGGSSEPPHGCSTPVLEPTEELIVHLVVPRGWTTPATASVRMTPSDPDGVVAALRGDGEAAVGVLPFEGAVRHTGQTLEGLRLPECPGLPELVTNAARSAGWTDAAFDVYRCIVKYPVLHAMVHMWADGPRQDTVRTPHG